MVTTHMSAKGLSCGVSLETERTVIADIVVLKVLGL